jgi:hypothetical protein
MRLGDLPAHVARAVLEATHGGQIAAIERHELRARPTNGQLVRVEPPMVVYEVLFAAKGRTRLVQLADTPALKLPSAARAALASTFSGAEVVDVEEESGATVYEATLERTGGRLEVLLAPSGDVIAVQVPVEARRLPPAVAQAIARVTEGAQVRHLERQEVRARPTWVPLAEPEVTYEVAFVRAGEEFEMEFRPDGSVIGGIESEGEPEAED